MTQPLRIIVADDEPLLVEELSAYLHDAGHQVVATASHGKELVDRCKEFKPDLIVTDIKMPGMDGLEALEAICRRVLLPAVIVSAYHDEDYIQRATEQSVISYLIKPVDEVELKVALQVAMRRFHEFESLAAENCSLRQTLDDRKFIERAKGILMNRDGINEESAFLLLQQLARKKSLRTVELAKTMLDAEEA